MAEGTVDVRTRDNQRHGKWRVDDLAEHLKEQKPAPSESFNSFYKNAFDPSKFARVKHETVEVPSEKNATLDDLEKRLDGKQWLNGKAPSAADREALAQIKSMKVSPIEYPNVFGWLSIAGKFVPAIQESWP